MPVQRSPGGPSLLQSARSASATTLFICKRCPTGSALRCAMKASVKAAGRKAELRVVASGCLDVCPKRGSAAIVAAADAPARCIIISASANAGALVRALLDERVSNAVTN